MVTSLAVAATGFGVLLMSFMQSSRQSGPVMGAVLTITGMLGGLFTAWTQNLPPIFDVVNHLFPQGWALHGWRLALSGAPAAAALPSAAILAGYGLLLFAAAVLIFRRRYA